MKRLLRWTALALIVLVLSGFMFLRSMGMFASDPVFSTSEGAINGYDPVAYFDEQQPVKGSEEFSTEWNGATWYFSSAQRLQRFTAEPERYAPQFGGYCAMAVASGYTAKTDPSAFAIVDDKLYLNFDPSVRDEWYSQSGTLIPEGHSNWPGVLLGH